jgi:lysophospholipase L1-like esterase
MLARSILASALAAGLAFSLPGSAQAQALEQASPRFVAETPTARVDYWQVRAADIAKQLAAPESLKPIRIVFVGDSITDFWHLDANPWFPGKFCGRAVWDESFGGANPAWTALNLGVSGDRIEHVLHRLQPASEGGEGWLDRADLQPDRIFVLLGINNSFDAEKPATDSIVRGVTATIARIRERKPDAQIVVQSLLPTDDPAKNRDLVLPVNAALAALAKGGAGLRYLDLYAGFVDDAGAQRRDLFNDGLHPSQAGYRVWRDRVAAFLRTG